MKNRSIGQTQDGSFQIGVRKTLAATPQQAWDLITSAEGLKLWLGEAGDFRLEKGRSFETTDGAQGEVRVLNPGGHTRLTWRPRGWRRASTIQIRVIPSGERTSISFHQENLPDAEAREAMRRHWQQVLDEMEKSLGGEAGAGGAE
jgi:uncharacterized protein YndB with AHSA1/START domain